MYIQATGRYCIEVNSIKVVLDPDFCKFYKWLYDKAFWNTVKTQVPKHGAHIGVVNPNIHKNVDTTKFRHLNRQIVSFKYSIQGYSGGFTKGFKNYWFDVQCKELEDIARDLGVIHLHKGFSYFHITILNNKNLR